MDEGGQLVELSRPAVMWTLAFAIYASLKLLTWVTRYDVPVPLGRHLAYLLAWPGMDVDAFLNAANRPVQPPSVGEWLFAAFKPILGLTIFGVAIWLSAQGGHPWWVGWAAILGIAFMLNFGLFHLLACFWKTKGLRAVPIMDWPILATSLTQFWGKRWNRAFRDLTHQFLFRPLAPRVGPVWAMLAGFLVSGLVHDLVISIPAGGGYGWPTLYFLIQGGGVLLERSWLGRRIGLGGGAIGWTYAALLLLLPVGMLFHAPFVEGVIAPMVPGGSQSP
ncbi:MAG: membrane bound O-acyl transferase family-domain-containing protein [Pirellulaceae bacterium]